MKKGLTVIVAIVLCAAFAVALTACNNDKSDWEQIQESGELVIGITYFRPMNYYEGEALVGFETEFATAACELLGVTPVFQEINWNNKIVELGAEQQSAGEKAIKATAELADNAYVPLEAQSTVLNELNAGTIDVGFIDIVMATASIGEGTDYSNLMMVEGAIIGDDELYGIGVRKGSDLLAQINSAIQTLYDNGTLATIAAKYGLSDALVAPQA